MQFLKESTPATIAGRITEDFDGLVKGYTELRFRLRRLAIPDQAYYIDCSRVFDDRPHTVFSDLWHFSDVGQAILGEYLADQLDPILSANEGRRPTSIPSLQTYPTILPFENPGWSPWVLAWLLSGAAIGFLMIAVWKTYRSFEAALPPAPSRGTVAMAINGMIQVFVGLSFLVVSDSTFGEIVQRLTQHELAVDPTDLVANYLVQLAHHVSGGVKWVAAIYLLGAGGFKVYLAREMWLRKGWSYPAAIGSVIVLTAYQIYYLSNYHSTDFVPLTLFNVLIFVLVLREYPSMQENRLS
jgi:uncharacterized membrane protein